MAGPSSVPNHGSGKPRKKARPSASSEPSINLAELEEINLQSRKAYGKAERTVNAYASYIAKGKEFLALTVEAWRSKGEALEKDGIDTDLLEKAFDKPCPNQLSAKALELFLVHKCFGSDGCGPSTAERIQAAFCDYWDNMDGEEYTGAYQYNKECGTVRGCPARARDVKALLKRIKNKNGIEGGKALRNHARPIRIEDLAWMMEWSEKIVPSTSLERLDVKDITLETVKHVLMRAFLPSAFTLWTRNSELCAIQIRDLEMGCIGPAPHFFSHFKVRLLHRKGWQKQMDSYDGPLRGRIYEIYKQDINAVDMYTHFQRWKWFLEDKLLSCKLTDHDFIFPIIGSNGVIYPKQRMSYDTAQEYINEFQQNSGLTGQFTTHSFRRGGAQYRFMHAPTGQRWTLSRIRWWGGWVKGEHIDTLIRYLLDSVQNEETNHSDALCPVQQEADRSLAGEHKLTRPMTTEEFRTEMYAFHMTIKKDITDTIASSIPSIAGTPSFPNNSNAPPVPAVPTLPVYPIGHQQPSYCHYADTQPSASYLPLAHPLTNASNTMLRQILPRPPAMSDQQLNVIPLRTTLSLTAAGGAPKHRAIPPIPDLRIDDLGKGPNAWLEAVHQWNVAASPGVAPLRSWSPHWYQGVMAPYFASKRSQRKTIAEEYARYNSDKDTFLRDYPMASNVKHLLNAIRMHHQRRRTSCNGTPEERDSRVAGVGPVRRTTRAACQRGHPTAPY